MPRSVDLARWQPHLEEARRRGLTLKAYAAEAGVSVYSLYRASQISRANAYDPPPSTTGAFVAVRAVSASVPPAPLLRVAAQLPNGVSLQVETSAAGMASVIASLGALRCSA
jgi:hypothetical protein